MQIIHLGNTISGGQKSDIISYQGICSSLTATDYKQPKQIGVYEYDRRKTTEAKRHFS